MRRPRQGNLRNRPLEHDSILPERLKRRSLRLPSAITPHMIRPQRIDGDQYNTRPPRAGRWCGFAGLGLVASARANSAFSGEDDDSRKPEANTRVEAKIEKHL